MASSVTGFEELAEELHEFGEGLQDCAGDEMQDVADTVAAETAEAVAEDASRFAPVDEGRLRELIFVWPTPPAPGERIIVAATEYSAFVEYGTFAHIIPPSEETTYDRPIIHPGANPKPYMRPAMWYNIRTMNDVFEREISRLFRRHL